MSRNGAQRAGPASGGSRPLLAGARLAWPLVALVALFGGLACNGDETSGDGNTLELFITPGETTTTVNDLWGNASIHHPLGVEVTFLWSWERDGVDAGISTNTVSSSDTLKNQTWQVTVVADLDGSTAETASARVRIVNSPPTVTTSPIQFSQGACSIAFPPANVGDACTLDLQCGFAFPLRGQCSPRADSTLSVTVLATDDADGDTVTVAYQWLVNDVEVATTPTLDSSFFVAGDVVSVAVTPNDGQDDGEPATPPPVVIQPAP